MMNGQLTEATANLLTRWLVDRKLMPVEVDELVRTFGTCRRCDYFCPRNRPWVNGAGVCGQTFPGVNVARDDFTCAAFRETPGHDPYPDRADPPPDPVHQDNEEA